MHAWVVIYNDGKILYKYGEASERQSKCLMASGKHLVVAGRCLTI